MNIYVMQSKSVCEVMYVTPKVPDVGRRHGNMMVFAGIAHAQPK